MTRWEQRDARCPTIARLAVEIEEVHARALESIGARLGNYGLAALARAALALVAKGCIVTEDTLAETLDMLTVEPVPTKPKRPRGRPRKAASDGEQKGAT